MVTSIVSGTVSHGVSDFGRVTDEQSETLTIEGLFTLASEALLTASHVDIKYDYIYGIPTFISVDWKAHVYDDECTYKVIYFNEF